jgi:hypothetical protein
VERRTFLVLSAAAVGLAGCTSDSSEPGPPSAPAPTRPPSDPDARVRDEVAASEIALVAAYRSAIATSPELAADLEPFVAQHEAHVARVAPGFATSSTPSGSASMRGSASASANPSGSASASPSASARSVADTLSALAAAESAAQVQRATACDAAQGPALARELCLIAASEAQHAAALAGWAARESRS